MTNFNYYKSKEIYREKYYQMPKVFFTSSQYKELSNDSKIAYMLLKDRFDYSVQNEWVDENDNVFFVFTITELMQLLNCREGKISKIKKELEAVNLLRQEKGRMRKVNGTLHSTPNRLYLAKPEVSSTDVYKIKELDTGTSSTVIAKIANTVKPYTDSYLSDYSQVYNGQKSLDNNISTVTAKIADNLYKEYIDTNRHIIDSKKQSIQDQILLDNFSETYASNSTATFVPKKVLSLIATFSNTFEEAETTLRTIHNAKHKAETQEDCNIFFEEISNYGINAENELYQTLLKAYQKNKTDKVQNIQNLIFVYVKNWFVEQPIRLKLIVKNNIDLPEVSVQNWINS